MKLFFSILRITGLTALAVVLIDLTLDVGDQSPYQAYPVLWLILAVIVFIAIAIEVSVASLRSLLYRSLTPEAKESYDAFMAAKEEKRSNWLKKTYRKLIDRKPVEKEDEIVLDHNYDGIRELDNNLPPWWLYGFYASIIFAFVYLARYHIFNGTTQIEEFNQEMAEAKAAVEEYKKNADDLIDMNTVERLTGEADLKAGQSIFETKCFACHKMDGGGGIGPNLTDDYWINGGGIKNVFHTISEGGRAGKGMVAWKTELTPKERAQVASYVLSLHGTEPASPKEPQGELWVDPDAPKQEQPDKQTDSIKANTGIKAIQTIE
ncbi:cytochrome C oxidase subunit III [Christiangramia fulva]|uniref:Cytochrome C oxidase subunit III n=1 Tax=Christiangramia fulva TaxID=2126553 RepID=A0A2R3Z250_9FLAO|nr:cbb3-type cytochrome c oxidase N-terminal domain-containing protein [Christiangramia fulva]AVR44350.1 cytochrome C oxidase subunit III [Christiangramia fulva]